ncbi:MAG: 2,3,4,5-tetrahydropyridine-2,6-dicarboxylate N-succinyltransferase, partial [Flavobacteriales bacterium]|nr:2,3,4,5-tetrahydropyridine-2,6-dicarboxylate N-succinyltransferase [Flavobacteriales bacterium]
MHEMIELAWKDRDLLRDPDVVNHIETVIEKLDRGELRVATPPGSPDGEWVVNDWVKKAVIMYFPIRQMHTYEVGPLEFHDKMKLKHGYAQLGV